jgi:hypothetical protein
MAPIFIFITAFVTVLISISAVNIYANIGQYFYKDDKLERRAATYIAEGKYVVGNAELKLPSLQTMLAQSFARAPETIVFGSSRAMQVGAREIGSGVTVFNHSVNTALLETHMGLFAIYDQRGIYPSQIVIGVDPWIFKKFRIDTSFETYLEPLRRFTSTAGITMFDVQAPPTWRISNLFSVQRTVAAFKTLDTDHCSGIRAAQHEQSDCAVRRPDMTLRYPIEWRRRTAEEVSATVSLVVSRRGRMHGFDGFDSIDPGQVKRFQAFLRYLQKKNIQTVLLLVPYHPLVSNILKDSFDWKLTMEVESRVKALAASMRLPVYGSYNPVATKCGISDFFDEMHPRPRCLRKIYAGLKDGK